MAYAGNGASSLLMLCAFVIWALLPYAVLLACSALTGTRGRGLAAFIVSLLASGLALLVYCDAMFVHTNSTSGLVFLAIPLYQFITAVILLAVLFFSRPSDASRKTPKNPMQSSARMASAEKCHSGKVSGNDS